MMRKLNILFRYIAGAMYKTAQFDSLLYVWFTFERIHPGKELYNLVSESFTKRVKYLEDL